MTPTTLPTIAALCAVLLPAGLAATAVRSADARTVPAVAGGPTPLRIDAAGCDVLILWNTYRGSIDTDRGYVRVRGALTWTNIRETGLAKAIGSISPPPPAVQTNGRIWNWKEDLIQDRCDRDRRYRFRVVAPPKTAEPVVSNEPYAGTERWIYFPSSTGWTRSTTIDLGYLDACVMDAARCSKPYYPSGPTPVLKW